MSQTKGPRELGLRAMREANRAPVRGRDPSKELADMTAALIGHPPTNAPDVAAQPKETKMKTSTAKKTAARKPAKTAKKTARRAPGKAARAPAAREGGIRPGSKLEAVVSLLRRPEGCTGAEALAATGWPAISMPAQAKAAGLTLRKEKVKGEPTRYYAG